jgi:uncharacterized membrane protein HdeD (DUF308 family)
MLLSLLDILAFSFIFEPLAYLIIPSFYGNLSATGRCFQVVGILSFLISIIFLFQSFASGVKSVLLFFLFFGISYISGIVCLNLDPERDKKKEKI